MLDKLYNVLLALLIRLSLIVFSLTITLLLVEGACSIYDFADFFIHHRSRVPHSRSFTEYDSELGWISKNNFYRADNFGRNRDLQTNSQHFRAVKDYTYKISNDITRIICSGDSFVYGHGVANSEVWCELLSSRDPKIETINLGEPAYGIDQAYLRYKRDGIKFEHDAQIFGFISDDFLRMTRSDFMEYHKPVLFAQNDRLVVKNVPVPRRSYIFPTLTHNLFALDKLHFVKKLRPKLAELTLRKNISTGPSKESLPKILRIIFRELNDINKRKKSKLFVVHFPVATEYNEDSEWTPLVEAILAEQDIPFINLIDELRKLPTEHAKKLFSGGNGHFKAEGNRWVADEIHKRIQPLKPREHSS